MSNSHTNEKIANLVHEDDDLRITDDADPLVSPSTEKHKQETGKSDYFKVEQKLREERIAKKLIPTSKDAEEDNHTIRTQLRRDRQNPKYILYGPPSKKRESGSVFSDADFEAVKKTKGNTSGLGRKVKRIR